MTIYARKKLIHEGALAAEVKVELIDDETGWSPCLSIRDAQKLDEVRKALQCGDIKRASQFGRVYELTPVSI